MESKTKVILTIPRGLNIEIKDNTVMITGKDKISFEAGLEINGKQKDLKDFKTTSNNKLLLM